MAINKVLVRSDDPAQIGGEWVSLQYNSTDGGLKLVSLKDSVRPLRQVPQVVKVPLAGATIHAAAGGVVSWANPEGVSIIVTRVILDVTTVATGACTFDVGYTASSAATTSDTFLDGVDVNAAVAVFDSQDPALDSGSNAHAQKVAAGKWITLDEKTGDATGLVGNLYIYYQVL